MPLSKRRKKNGKKKPRDRGAAPSEPVAPATPAEPARAGGFLTRMRGGFQNVAGSGAKKKESLLSKLLTWALVALAAYFLARRFGILP